MVEQIGAKPNQSGEDAYYSGAKSLTKTGKYITGVGVAIAAYSWWTGGGLTVGLVVTGIGAALTGLGLGLKELEVTPGAGKGEKAPQQVAKSEEQVGRY